MLYHVIETVKVIFLPPILNTKILGGFGQNKMLNKCNVHIVLLNVLYKMGQDSFNSLDARGVFLKPTVLGSGELKIDISNKNSKLVICFLNLLSPSVFIIPLNQNFTMKLRENSRSYKPGRGLSLKVWQQTL